MRILVTDANGKSYWYRSWEEMEKKVKVCIMGPYLVWPNYSSEASRAKASASGWHLWESFGNWYLTDPCGETRYISWGTNAEMLYYESWAEFDKAQQEKF